MLVLIVDDDRGVADTLKDLVEEEGWQAMQVDGPNALPAAEQYHPDAIVLDLMMPGIDGWAVREQLWRSPVTGTTPVIIFSALSAEDRLDARLLAVAVVEKPLGVGTIIPILRAVTDTGGGNGHE